MEILVVALLVGALWCGYKLGIEAGRNALINSQSASIEDDLRKQNSFFEDTGLHGTYALEGHENRAVTGFVIVKLTDLRKLLDSKENYEDPDQSIPPLQYPPEVEEKLMSPTGALAFFVGSEVITHSEASRRVFKYVEDNSLTGDRRYIINCDSALIELTGSSTCTLFKLTKIVGENLREQKDGAA